MSQPTLCLTIDIDWAHDVVIADTLALIVDHGMTATWFVTHATPMLDEIARAPGQELGVHPNFNPLLAGTGVETASASLLKLRALVPEAVSVRSHSLTRSSRLASLFRENGFTHESNFFLPPVLGTLAPWLDVSGLMQVPIRWEDDVRLLDPSLGEPAQYLNLIKPLVVDVHPIHIFLNSLTILDYEASRVDASDPEALLKRRRPPNSGGTRDRLLDLLRASRLAGITGVRMRDIQSGA